MSKTIQFTYKGIDYTLEFTKRSIQTMERNGFKTSDLTDKPLTAIPELFQGAFLAHHKWTKPDLIEEIYNHFPKRDELFGKLVDMYNEPILEMVEEPEESEGNVNWTASF